MLRIFEYGSCFFWWRNSRKSAVPCRCPILMPPHSICSVLSCNVCHLHRSNNKFRLRKLLLGTGYFTSTSYHSLSLYNCLLLHTSHHSFSSSMPPTQILLPLLQFWFLRVMIARIYEWRALRLGMSGMSLHQSIERESQSCLNELGTVTNITCLSMLFYSISPAQVIETMPPPNPS